jgi:hypothetical protein
VANTRPSVNKRRKEASRREKKAAKAEKRAQRTADKSSKGSVLSGEEDPDIAGIVPGPQPLPWAEFADIEPEEDDEQAEEQEEGEEKVSSS